MNVFADLARPLVFRPGDPTPEPKRVNREVYRRRGIEDHELTPEQLKKREGASRRPSAGLPAVQNPWDLRPVQVAIAGMLVEGLDNHEIAQRLDLSVKTVESHVQTMKRLMESPSRTRCAVLWDRFTRGEGKVA